MPGSGKGTQAAMLMKKLDFHHICLGEILRSYSLNKTELGQHIKSLIDEGKLIGDEIVNQIIIDEITKFNEKDIILDGFPRTIEQMHFLEKKILHKKVIFVYFKVESDNLLKRLLDRVTCAECKKVFSNSILKDLNYICDECNSKKFIKRNDDDRITILNRIEIFNKKTYPINFFELHSSQI
jgi:adenylate kinase